MPNQIKILASKFGSEGPLNNMEYTGVFVLLAVIGVVQAGAQSSGPNSVTAPQHHEHVNVQSLLPSVTRQRFFGSVFQQQLLVDRMNSSDPLLSDKQLAIQALQPLADVDALCAQAAFQHTPFCGFQVCVCVCV